MKLTLLDSSQGIHPRVQKVEYNISFGFSIELSDIEIKRLVQLLSGSIGKGELTIDYGSGTYSSG